MAADIQRPDGSSATVPSNLQNGTSVLQHSASLQSTAINRKKAKRRAKQAAKHSVTQDHADRDEFDSDGALPPNGRLPQSQDFMDPAYDHNLRYSDPAYARHGDPINYTYSDEENEFSYDPASQIANGGSVDYVGEVEQSRGKGKKKKRRDVSAAYDGVRSEVHGHTSAPQRPAYAHRTPTALAPRAISDDALRTVQRGINNGIWNTSSAEERSSIKAYWLALGEDERKALVKIEKNDVLKKMKDQQKHSCSCTVCGRKRVAIEEELEVLYDAYYQELEQYANHNQHLSENGTPMLPPPRRYSSNSSSRPPLDRPSTGESQRPARGRILHEVEHEEDEGDLDEEDEEEYSEEEYDDEEDSADERDNLPASASEFFTFGKSLTVKGGILTVADDLLKNDGQKFIDMMEQLAERRMQREEQAQFAPYASHPSVPPQHTHADHSHLPPEEEEYDDEEEEDYGSEDEEYEDEDEDAMTESQRMDEGRRMFQIFAARMFEQRVLTAYREQLAKQRTEQFLRELDEEKQAKSEAGAKNAAKKAKQKAKEKAKKEALKEEKQRKADEKASAERAEEERKLEEKRRRDDENRRKEEERKRKLDAARRAQEEEKLRKKAEEREREEARRAREQKAREKREREEALKKERENEEREKRLQLERDEKDKQEQTKLDKESLESKRKLEAAQAQKPSTSAAAELPQPADHPRRAPLPAIVALPPGLKSKQSNIDHESPQSKIATPATPKPPTPVRPKELATRVSQSSTPVTPDTAPRSKHSSPPIKMPAQQNPSLPPLVPQLRTASQQLPISNASHPSALHTIAPPPGMHLPQGVSHMGMPQMGPNGFPGVTGSMMPGAMQHRIPIGLQMPIYPPHGSHMGPHHRPFMPPSAGVPPGINSPLMPQLGRGYIPEAAPLHIQHNQNPLPGGMQAPYSTARDHIPLPHSRQTSTSYDAPPSEPQTPASATQPIARPAPIKRPASVKPQDWATGKPNKAGSEIDELSTRLGSSALLDDNDEPLPVAPMDNRRTSATMGSSLPTQSGPGYISSPYDHVQLPFSSMGAPGDSWRSVAPPYGTAPSGWGQNASSGGWGSVGSFSMPLHPRGGNMRPVTVRSLATKAYKTLSSQSHGFDGGYYDFGDVLRLTQDSAHQMQESMPPGPRELLTILDTEGDAHNGGGSFIVRHLDHGRTLVKWQPDMSDMGGNRTGQGLGQIGSPVPNISIPALGGLGPGSRGF